MSDDLRLPGSIETIPATLAFWAERAPEAPALIVAGGPVISYGALSRASSTLAGSLQRCGIDQEDRIVLLIPDGPRLAMAMLGTAAAAVAIPLSFTLTLSELQGALRGLDAVAAIVDPGLPPPVRACLAQNGVAVFDLTANDVMDTIALAGQPAREPRLAMAPQPQPEDTAVVMLTSGTTGLPKRIPRTHGWIVQSGRVHRDRFGLGHHDRALAVAPTSLSLGSTALLHGMAAGSALVFPASFDPRHLCTAIAAERPTWMHAGAGVLEVLARFLETHPEVRLPPSLRFVRVTAAPISPRTCDVLAARLGAAILPGYSTSELGLIASTFPAPEWNKPGSVGRPMQEMEIVDDQGRPVAPGTVGEIWVRRRKDYAGYLGGPGTGGFQLMPGGWLRTGDAGYLDAGGFLFLTGRFNELINRGGAKIAPGEVDQVLLEHPAVQAAAAFAVPDERLGQDIVAAVVLEPGREASPRALRSWMLDRLEPHKAPRRIWFIGDLPRTASGKVQRGELARRWKEERA